MSPRLWIFWNSILERMQRCWTIDHILSEAQELLYAHNEICLFYVAYKRKTLEYVIDNLFDNTDNHKKYWANKTAYWIMKLGENNFKVSSKYIFRNHSEKIVKILKQNLMDVSPHMLYTLWCAYRCTRNYSLRQWNNILT